MWTMSWSVIITVAVVALCATTSGYAEPRDRPKPKEEKEKQNIEAQRASLKADCTSVASGRRGAASLGNGSVPSEAVFAAMDKKERRELAVAAGCLHDRFLRDGSLPGKELSWMRRALECLHESDGDEASALIAHAYRDSVSAAGTQEQLNQAEALARAAYPEMAAGGGAEPGGFDRSRIRKDLIRKRLSLMREGAR